MEVLLWASKIGLENKLCHLNVSLSEMITDKEQNSTVYKIFMPVTGSRVYNSSFRGIDSGGSSQEYHLIFIVLHSPLLVSSPYPHNSANNMLV